MEINVRDDVIDDVQLHLKNVRFRDKMPQERPQLCKGGGMGVEEMYQTLLTVV